mmetsp:Transcript_33235/g.62062  ORF Transcript_33235/g.62062 Transcript_33235/m.62062 type:complete len:135 (+) Transcript_33235:1646-2050(+)
MIPREHGLNRFFPARIFLMNQGSKSRDPPSTAPLKDILWECSAEFRSGEAGLSYELCPAYLLCPLVNCHDLWSFVLSVPWWAPDAVQTAILPFESLVTQLVKMKAFLPPVAWKLLIVKTFQLPLPELTLLILVI